MHELIFSHFTVQAREDGVLLTLGCTEGETSTKLKLIILFYEFSVVHLTQIPSTWQCQQTPVHLHWVLGGRGERCTCVVGQL